MSVTRNYKITILEQNRFWISILLVFEKIILW
jgi:hypothetical protein